MLALGFIEPNYQGSTDCSDDKPEKFYKYHGHLYYDIELTDEGMNEWILVALDLHFYVLSHRSYWLF